MIKFTQFATYDSNGPKVFVLHKDHLEKTAEYLPEVNNYAANLKPTPGKTFLLVNAMTADEFFGPNLNGDAFPETQLTKYFKTFETHGYAYKHHQNKNPLLASGKVIFAAYNPSMHRVELIIQIENDKAGDIVQRIEKGEFPPVSMGVRTPSDQCSICFKRSTNVADYCDHLKHEMRHVYSDGRQVKAINNDKLTFFDISFVRIPADKTASVLKKIAEVGSEHVTPSAEIGEEILKSAGIKESTLVKEIDGEVTAANEDPKRLIFNSQPDFPRETIDKILQKHALNEVLSTLLGMRIMPKPEEFQYMVLYKTKGPEEAKQVYERKRMYMDIGEDPVIPLDVNIANFCDEIGFQLGEWARTSSLTKPVVIRRVLMKMAEEIETPAPAPVVKTEPVLEPIKNPLIPLLGMGALYIGYHKLFNNVGLTGPLANAGGFEKFLLSKPWLIPIVLGSAAMATAGIQKSFLKEAATFEPHFLKRMLISVPASYLYAGYAENKVQKGEPVSEMQNLVRKHPFLTGMAGTWGLGKMQKLIKSKGIVSKTAQLGSLDDFIYGLGPDKLEEFYNDVIGKESS